MIHKTKLLAVLTIYLLCIWTTTAKGAVRTIEVHVRRFAFQPSEITVKRGETVQLKLISDDVPHSLLLKDFGINQTITKNKPVEVTLTPKQAGTFHGQCGRFCGSGHGNMAFTVYVEGN